MVEDLEELLTRPLGGVVRAEVVEDQEWGAADPFEGLFEGCVFGVERGAQRVQQTGDGQEKRRYADLDRFVGDGRRQVRLAGTKGARQQEPALQGPGVSPAGFVGAAQRLLLLFADPRAAVRAEGREGQVPELIEPAQTEESIADVGAHLRQAAGADLETTEVRVAQSPFDADVAAPVAKRAIRLPKSSLAFRSRRNRRVGP